MACRRPSLRFRPPVPWWFRPPAPRRVLPTARLWVRPPAPCRGLHQLLYRSFPIPSAYALSPVRLPPAADRAATSCKILPVPRAPSAADRAATSCKILPVPPRAVRGGLRGCFSKPGFCQRPRRIAPRPPARPVPHSSAPCRVLPLAPCRHGGRVCLRSADAWIPPDCINNGARVRASSLRRCAPMPARAAAVWNFFRPRRCGVSEPPVSLRRIRTPAPKRLAPAPPSGLAPAAFPFYRLRGGV